MKQMYGKCVLRRNIFRRNMYLYITDGIKILNTQQHAV